MHDQTIDASYTAPFLYTLSMAAKANPVEDPRISQQNIHKKK